MSTGSSDVRPSRRDSVAPVSSLRLRDTRTYYLDLSPEEAVAPGHLHFAEEHAGRTVLDFGCAIGAYCLALSRLGFACTGVDVNPAYVERARASGVDAQLVERGETAPFPDASFDTVLLFEVLEHVPDYEQVLREAARLARKNVLITVPNCAGVQALEGSGLVFDHMLDQDHVNFFTPETLGAALSAIFPAHEVEQREFVDRGLLGRLLPAPIGKPLSALCVAGLIGRRFSYRLFARATV
jgi:2-polyprenyl-3-methyl-5-hydroxy-6-metoxy-1,4-benzoquinol methylase